MNQNKFIIFFLLNVLFQSSQNIFSAFAQKSEKSNLDQKHKRRDVKEKDPKKEFEELKKQKTIKHLTEKEKTDYLTKLQGLHTKIPLEGKNKGFTNDYTTGNIHLNLATQQSLLKIIQQVIKDINSNIDSSIIHKKLSLIDKLVQDLKKTYKEKPKDAKELQEITKASTKIVDDFNIAFAKLL